MTTTFLPEFSTMKMAGGGYAGLYRLFEGDWRYVFDKRTRQASIFGSQSEAISAAREVVRTKLNPHLKCENIDAPDEADADVLQIEEWRAKQIEEYARSRAIVKNGRNRRQVVVEVRGKKRGKA